MNRARAQRAATLAANKMVHVWSPRVKGRAAAQRKTSLELAQKNTANIFSLLACSASHIRPFAWRPIDHGQSDHVFGRSVEAGAPGSDAEASASSRFVG
jgi:hypothetical protein